MCFGGRVRGGLLWGFSNILTFISRLLNGYNGYTILAVARALLRIIQPFQRIAMFVQILNLLINESALLVQKRCTHSLRS